MVGSKLLVLFVHDAHLTAAHRCGTPRQTPPSEGLSYCLPRRSRCTPYAVRWFPFECACFGDTFDGAPLPCCAPGEEAVAGASGQVRRDRSTRRELAPPRRGRTAPPRAARGTYQIHAFRPLLLPLSEELEGAGLGPAPLLLLRATLLPPLVLRSREQLGGHVGLLLREVMQGLRLVAALILQQPLAMLYGLDEVDCLDEVLERLNLFTVAEGRARVVLAVAELVDVTPALVVAAEGGGVVVSAVAYQHKIWGRRRGQRANRICARAAPMLHP